LKKCFTFWGDEVIVGTVVDTVVEISVVGWRGFDDLLTVQLDVSNC
jgi:hypothetical protein